MKKAHSKNLLNYKKGFNLVELEVTLVILAIGLFGLAGLFKVYSQQISFVERNCDPNMFVENPQEETKDLWLVSQTNEWMKQFAAPADINNSPGQTAWEPNVLPDRQYDVQLSTFDFNDTSKAIATVTVEKKQ